MKKLPVMEYFHSIQGEGFYNGQSAFFIRLGGCDVGCVWCDVKESWDAEKHPQTEISFLLKQAQKGNSSLVIITGGEPAMYDLTELTSLLKNNGFRIHIETSGVYPLLGHFDWITYSPKKFKAPLKEVASEADELKVVVFNKSDLAWAEQHLPDLKETCLLYLQPEWDKREITEQLVFEYVRKHPKWRISLQTHKYLGVD